MFNEEEGHGSQSRGTLSMAPNAPLAPRLELALHGEIRDNGCLRECTRVWLPWLGRVRRLELLAMPFYEYEVILENGEAGERFEVMQKMSDPPLTHHPETGEPVRRVISAPRIPGKYSDHAMKQTVNDDKKLGEMGFTKYVKAGDGHYEKRAGKGPDVISGQ